MLGRLLELIPSNRLGRVLTTMMYPGKYSGPCLFGVLFAGEDGTWNSAEAAQTAEACLPTNSTILTLRTAQGGGLASRSVDLWGQGKLGEARYDALCCKVGTFKANSLIRNRVLTILAHRTLKSSGRNHKARRGIEESRR